LEVVVEHFEVKIMWDETEGELPGWVSECAALNIALCDVSLVKLMKENRLAAETMREIAGKSMDFILDFKVEVLDLVKLAA
jgi:hypothetical protein